MIRGRRTGLAIGVVALVLAACGGGGGSSTSAPAPAPAPAPTPAPVSQTVTDKGIVTGKVVDTAGAPVGTASIVFDGRTVTTNEQGFFVVDNATPGADKALRFTKSGFAPGQTAVTVTAGQDAFLTLTLPRVGVTRTNLSAATQQVVTDARTDGRNGSVTIPANSVVDAQGRPVSTYTVELTTLVPNDPSFLASFPGRFLGGAAAGSVANPVPLISYGVVNVDLKDAQGNPLQLASSARATLTFPIGTGSADPGLPSVRLWSLDTATGIWKQEGTATRSGSTYVAQVSHFSPWNCDEPISNSGIKEVRVRGANGEPVANAIVTIDGTGYRQRANTNSEGVARIPVGPNDTIRVSVEKGTVRTPVVTETAPAAGNTKINVIDLFQPIATVMMSWGQAPADLDAHLTGPGGRHIWYAGRGNLTAEPFALLDTDDTSGFGPEIITVTRLAPGTYRYSVHNYSGQAVSRMESSGAVVNLVTRTGVIRRYDIPTTNPLASNGNQWVVFELNVDANGTPTVVDVGTFRAAGTTGSDIQ